MTVADFKTRVASFVSRSSSDFTSGGVDEILCAINDARRHAQRSYTFKTLRKDVFLETSILGADFQTACKLTPGGTAVKVKLIEKVWQYTTRTISAGTLYERTAQLDYRTDRQLGSGLPLAGSGASSDSFRITEPYTGHMIAWTKGLKLFVNVEASATYLVEAVERLDDITTETSDFFIDNAQDWLLWKTLECLNGYLKEDQRVGINTAILNRSWETFTQWDSDVSNSNDAFDLD